MDLTNTNREANPPKKSKEFLKWKDVTTYEIYGYLGILIYAGIHHIRQMKHLWKSNKSRNPLHQPVIDCMSRNRWEQINTYFHITPYSGEINGKKQTPFQKISELSIILQTQFAKYYLPGSHLAVDKGMEKFLGRSRATVQIPGKPIPIGFKVWILAHHGYVLNWLWHYKGDDFGPVDLNLKWVEIGFTKTEAIVLTLMERLPNKGKGSIIYIDNLFTSTRLLRRLREMGIGGSGTCRDTKTAREETEAKRAQKEQGEASQAQAHAGEASQAQEQGRDVQSALHTSHIA
jgi:hypothetical protein